ncbi:MAG: ABC transporter substrate-binding protein [Actinomycetota bacterium]|nr:ABC transporter substrate-binding protein [Actinomycetota bacterium]
MRKTLIALFALSLILVGCAEEEDPTVGGGGGSSPDSCATEDLPLYQEGVLTVATDRPAFEPWFKGSPKAYSGFEGDLATEVADRLGLPIEWVVEPFNKSYAPGQKDYDFDINQITITPERDQAVDFSDGYFNNTQGLLAPKDSDLIGAETIADVRDAQFGAQVGTTSLDFISTEIQPTDDPKIFDTTNDAKSALESGQIDAFVTDLQTVVYLRDFEIEGTEVVGQFPTNEQFGMLFEQGNPLRDCVNQVLAEIKDDGTLQELEDKWLDQYTTIPTLEE